METKTETKTQENSIQVSQASLMQTRGKSWESFTLSDIKQILCPLATDKELVVFAEKCRVLGANPLLGEIDLIKYKDGEPATTVVRKDYFLKRADSFEGYQGFEAGVIVSDNHGKFEYLEGAFVPDGRILVGGWATVFREGRRPYKKALLLKEYQQYRWSPEEKRRVLTKMWAEKPATMIVKCAVKQAHLEAFPSGYSGLHDAIDSDEIDADPRVVSTEAPEVVKNEYIPKKLTEDELWEKFEDAEAVPRVKPAPPITTPSPVKEIKAERPRAITGEWKPVPGTVEISMEPPPSRHPDWSGYWARAKKLGLDSEEGSAYWRSVTGIDDARDVTYEMLQRAIEGLDKAVNGDAIRKEIGFPIPTPKEEKLKTRSVTEKAEQVAFIESLSDEFEEKPSEKPPVKEFTYADLVEAARRVPMTGSQMKERVKKILGVDDPKKLTSEQYFKMIEDFRVNGQAIVNGD